MPLEEAYLKFILMSKQLTTEEFIVEARQIHGDKYDYSKVEYVNRKTKVCIICPIHGEFWQTPNSHLQGYSCPECGKLKQLNNVKNKSIKVFLNRACKIHDDKYQYPNIETEYRKNNKKIPILCKKCGNIFYQTPANHIFEKSGCPICAGNKRKTKEEFIKELKIIFKDKYDYSKIEYVNSDTKVELICRKKDILGREHGSFYSKPSHLLKGHGCPY